MTSTIPLDFSGTNPSGGSVTLDLTVLDNFLPQDATDIVVYSAPGSSPAQRPSGLVHRRAEYRDLADIPPSAIAVDGGSWTGTAHPYWIAVTYTSGGEPWDLGSLPAPTTGHHVVPMQPQS